MTRYILLDQLKARGLIEVSRVSLWRDASELLALIDVIGREGASAVVKVDGMRGNGCVYTIVLSGGPLGEDYFHKDGADLLVLLQEAIEFYHSKIWAKKR